MTPSMKIALEDLELDSFYVIYPGNRTYNLNEKVQVTSLEEFLKVS
jgi:hypothetical protein